MVDYYSVFRGISAEQNKTIISLLPSVKLNTKRPVMMQTSIRIIQNKHVGGPMDSRILVQPSRGNEWMGHVDQLFQDILNRTKELVEPEQLFVSSLNGHRSIEQYQSGRIPRKEQQVVSFSKRNQLDKTPFYRQDASRWRDRHPKVDRCRTGPIFPHSAKTVAVIWKWSKGALHSLSNPIPICD